MKHITEEQLIQYLYDLDEANERILVQEHLDSCEQCQKMLADLKAKFGQLEVLNDEPELTEKLIESTLNAVSGQSVKPKYWLKIAAMLVLIFGVSLVYNYWPAELEKSDEQYAISDSDTENADLPIVQERAIAKKETKSLAMAFDDIETIAEDKLDVLLAKEPFAPASNIELNVLPKRKNVQLTIYNGADLTLVREKRDITVNFGWNWMQLMWIGTKIDPTSLELNPLLHANEIEIQQLTFPPRLEKLGRWLMSSKVSGQVPMEITYLTSGLSWRAFYAGTLNEDETKMDLDAYVRVQNDSGETYENAQTRLVVGEVNLQEKIADLATRQYAFGLPAGAMLDERLEGLRSEAWNFNRIVKNVDEFAIEFEGGTSVRLKFDGDVDFNYFYADSDLKRPKEIVKQALSEYQLYTIEGTETITDKWAKRLPSFAASDIDVKTLYKYDEELYGTKAIRFVAFANDAEHELGQTPMPKGNIRMFGKVDSDGHLNYVGASDMKYVPINEKVELNLGVAEKVMVEPKLMDYKTENYRYDSKGNIIGSDLVKSWAIEINNTRSIPVDIEITRNFESQYWDIDFKQQGVEYEKHDISHGRFELTMAPGSKRVVSYVLRLYTGTRCDEKVK